MNNTVGIHNVIVSTVHKLELVTYNTPDGSRFGVAAQQYEHYETLQAQVDANPTIELGSTIMMDFDRNSVHSPFFTTPEQACDWGLKNFPHLVKYDLADRFDKVWGWQLLSPQAVNRAWMSYVLTSDSHPVAHMPDWVEPLRAANSDPISGNFLTPHKAR